MDCGFCLQYLWLCQLNCGLCYSDLFYNFYYCIILANNSYRFGFENVDAKMNAFGK